MIIRAFPLLGSRELLRRLGVTLAVLTVIRFGQTAPLPSFRAAAVASAGAGGSAAAAAAIAAATGGGSMEAALEGGLGRHAAASEAALLDLGGGDGGGGDPPTGAVSLLSLGIGPTINASWLFSIVTLLRLPKEWGVDPFKGARRLLTALRSGNRDDVAAYGLIVNLTAAAFAALAGWRTAAALAPFVRPPCPPGFTGEAAALLATGALITRWLTSMVDEHGLGDGVSLLIAMAVVSGYARSLRGFGAALSGTGWSAAATVAAGSAVAACSLAIVSAAVWLTQVETRLPLVVYARRRVPALRGGSGGASPWAAYAAWGAAGEAAAAAGQPPPAFDKALAAAAKAEKAAAAAARAPAAPAAPGVGAAPVVLGAVDASYLPLRLTPGAMGPLLMGSLALHLLPSALGLLWPAAGAALAAWLGRPLVGPLATACLIVGSEAAATASREGPRSLSEWMASSEVGLRGVPPGAATEAALATKTRATRLAGAAALAALSLAAAGVDAGCRAAFAGAAPGSTALLLCAGFVASSERQVAALVATPKLERALAQERRAVRALYRLERRGGELTR